MKINIVKERTILLFLNLREVENFFRKRQKESVVCAIAGLSA